MRSRIWRCFAPLFWNRPVYFRVRVETALTTARLRVRTELSREQNIVTQRGASKAEWGTPRCLTVNEAFCLKRSKKKRSEFGWWMDIIHYVSIRLWVNSKDAGLLLAQRLDGRQTYDYRRIKISFGADYGCCFVELGETRWIWVGMKGV